MRAIGRSRQPAMVARMIRHESVGKGKIIGVGMHKTGTKSLANALRTLGYTVTGPFAVHEPVDEAAILSRALETLRDFDAAQDNPWPFLYREIDAAYPGSKFILTRRDPDDWIDSVLSHFGGRSTPMREWIYGPGDPAGNADRYLDVYNRHNEELTAHFAGRPATFMTLDVSEDVAWSRLCDFLGVPEPMGVFPHANSRQGRKASGRLSRLLRTASG